MLLQDEVTIERIRPEALPEVFRIWDLSFAPPYSTIFPDDYARNQLSFLLGAIHKGKVAAVCGVINFQMRFGSSVMPCGGIAAVATHPSYRRHGLTGRLLKATLDWLYQERYPLSCLWPFKYSFYEHYGWCVSDKQFRVTLDIDAIQKVGSPGGYEEVLSELFTNEDARRSLLTSPDLFGENEPLPARHREWCQMWNLSLKRAPQRWRRLFSGPTANWLAFQHADGYMLIERSESQEETLVVREWCYMTDRAFHDGLALLSQLDSQYQKVSYLAGEVDSLLKLGVPHDAAITYLPGMMTRIVHPGAFEDAIGTKLTDVRIVDPTGISNTHQDAEFDELDTIGPGQLVQLVTGFFDEAPTANLQRLHKVRGKQKAFTVERF